MSGIIFSEVTRTFKRDKGGDYVALQPISLQIPDGEFVAIVGPSGCGKTTLLRMVAGLDSPSSGALTVGGREVSGPGPDRAVVFQQFALLPWKTVRENIGFGLKCRGMRAAAIRPLVDHYLTMMQLEAHADAYPHQLSGGMQQRVAIARSFILEPSVLLMDEPFGALDAQTRIEMQEELVKLTKAKPRTVLFITHSVEEATYLADRVVVMAGRPGSILEIVDVASLRRSESWNDRAVEEVMELESFTRIRTRLWRLLRTVDRSADGRKTPQLSIAS
jgi:NitT/TauT family transport system ATP-binding protein